MAQTRLKSGNLHMVGGDNGTSGQVLKSRADGTFEWGAAIDPPTFSSIDYAGNTTAANTTVGQAKVSQWSLAERFIACICSRFDIFKLPYQAANLTQSKGWVPFLLRQ